MLSRRLDRAFLIALGTACLMALLHTFQILNFHELEAVDLRLKLRGARPADPRITVVTIDDPSLQTVGEWPWPRGVHAAFLDIVSRYHPKSIFLDMLFTEQSPDPAEDEKFAESIKNSGHTILAFFYASESPFQATFPIKTLRKHAAGLGYVNALPDQDGRMRRIHAWVEGNKKTYYHPAVLLTRREKENENEAEAWFKKLPVDRNQNLWINFPGGPHSYQGVSFGEVIRAASLSQEDFLKKMFTDKIVLIGHTATGTSDLKATPFSTQEPGVFLHAAALHTLLSGKTLRSMPFLLSFTIILLLCIISAAGAQRMPPLHGLILSLILSALYIIFNFLSFILGGWIFPLFLPIASIAASYVLTLYMKHLEVRMQREMIVRELEAAFEIQHKFLPQSYPHSNILDVSFECLFSKQVGGDLYDWVDLGNNRLAFCVGDVSGKGMPAAIYMAKAVSDFKSIQKNTLQPGELCALLNDRLAAQEQSTMFLTFLYVIIDLNQNKIFYSSAAHEPMIFFRKKTGEAIIVKDAQGTPLGTFEGMPYDTASQPFEKGDAFVLVSDGIKELRNAKGQEFGIERLRQNVQEQALKMKSAKDLMAEMFKILEKHREDTPPHDDRTMLCVVRV